MHEEAYIRINGQLLTPPQSMTVRVSLGLMVIDGEWLSDMGQLGAAYAKAAHEVLAMLNEGAKLCNAK